MGLEALQLCLRSYSNLKWGLKRIWEISQFGKPGVSITFRESISFTQFHIFCRGRVSPSHCCIVECRSIEDCIMFELILGVWLWFIIILNCNLDGLFSPPFRFLVLKYLCRLILVSCRAMHSKKCPTLNSPVGTFCS